MSNDTIKGMLSSIFGIARSIGSTLYGTQSSTGVTGAIIDSITGANGERNDEVALAVTVHNTGYRRKPFIVGLTTKIRNTRGVLDYIDQHYIEPVRYFLFDKEIIDPTYRHIMTSWSIPVLTKTINPCSKTRKARGKMPVTYTNAYLTVERVPIYPETKVSMTYSSLAWWIFLNFTSGLWAKSLTRLYRQRNYGGPAYDHMPYLYAKVFEKDIYKEIRLKLCYIYDMVIHNEWHLIQFVNAELENGKDLLYTADKSPAIPLSWLPMDTVISHFAQIECVRGPEYLLYEPIIDILYGNRDNWFDMDDVDTARRNKYNKQHLPRQKNKKKRID